MKNLLKNLRNRSLRESPLNFEVKAAEDDGAAVVYLYDVIDGYWGINSADFAKELDAIDAERIELRIDSPGGDVFQARAIATNLKRHKAHVVAYVDGIAASAATTIAAVADECHIAKGAFYMIHQAWTWAIGNADDLIQTAELLEKVDGEIVAEYAEKTGQDAQAIVDWMKAETWFTADEAVENGFCDSVIAEGKSQNRAQVAANLFNLEGFEHPPEALKAADPEQIRADNERRAGVLSRARHLEARARALTKY